MALTFGNTRVPHFTRVFHNNPRLLTRHPYMNFLRHYKRLNPKHGLTRLLQDGARTWRRLKSEEKLLYTQKAVLADLQSRGSVPSGFELFAPYPIEFDYKRRSMNAQKNITRSWRKLGYLPPSPARRLL